VITEVPPGIMVDLYGRNTIDNRNEDRNEANYRNSLHSRSAEFVIQTSTNIRRKISILVVQMYKDLRICLSILFLTGTTHTAHIETPILPTCPIGCRLRVTIS
jgi:hypothetical protein